MNPFRESIVIVALLCSGCAAIDAPDEPPVAAAAAAETEVTVEMAPGEMLIVSWVDEPMNPAAWRIESFDAANSFYSASVHYGHPIDAPDQMERISQGQVIRGSSGALTVAATAAGYHQEHVLERPAVDDDSQVHSSWYFSGDRLPVRDNQTPFRHYLVTSYAHDAPSITLDLFVEAEASYELRHGADLMWLSDFRGTGIVAGTASYHESAELRFETSSGRHAWTFRTTPNWPAGELPLVLTAEDGREMEYFEIVAEGSWVATVERGATAWGGNAPIGMLMRDIP